MSSSAWSSDACSSDLRELRRRFPRTKYELAERLPRIERDHVPGEYRAARRGFGAVVEPAFDADEHPRDAQPVDEAQRRPQRGMLEQRIGKRARRQQRDESGEGGRKSVV